MTYKELRIAAWSAADETTPRVLLQEVPSSVFDAVLKCAIAHAAEIAEAEEREKTQIVVNYSDQGNYTALRIAARIRALLPKQEKSDVTKD